MTSVWGLVTDCPYMVLNPTGVSTLGVEIVTLKWRSMCSKRAVFGADRLELRFFNQFMHRPMLD